VAGIDQNEFGDDEGRGCSECVKQKGHTGDLLLLIFRDSAGIGVAGVRYSDKRTHVGAPRSVRSDTSRSRFARCDGQAPSGPAPAPTVPWADEVRDGHITVDGTHVGDVGDVGGVGGVGGFAGHQAQCWCIATWVTLSGDTTGVIDTVQRGTPAAAASTKRTISIVGETDLTEEQWLTIALRCASDHSS